MVGGDRDGQRPRQSSGEGARAGETASQGRRSGEDRDAAETMRRLTPQTQRDLEASTGARGVERLKEGLREARPDGGRGRTRRGRSGEAGEPRRQ